MKKENEVGKIARSMMLDAMLKEAERQIRFWNILFYCNSIFFGINIVGSFIEGRAWTFNLILSLGMMIYCYYYIREKTKIYNVVEEARNGQGNTGKTETEPSEPNKSA